MPDQASLLLFCFGLTPSPTSARFSLFADRDSGGQVQPLQFRPFPAEKARNLSDSLSRSPKWLTPKNALGRRTQPPVLCRFTPSPHVTRWQDSRKTPKPSAAGLDFALSMALNTSGA